LTASEIPETWYGRRAHALLRLPDSTPREEHAMTTTTTTIEAAPAIRLDDGEAHWWWGWLAVIKLTGAQTNGGLTVVEVTIPPGRMCPPHVHHREEETFLVLEGSATYQIGDQEIDARPGEFIVGPRDIPHRFKVGEDGARVLFLLT